MPDGGDVGWRTWDIHPAGIKGAFPHVCAIDQQLPDVYTAFWGTGTAHAICAMTKTRTCGNQFGGHGGQPAPCLYRASVVQCGVYASPTWEHLVESGYGPHRGRSFSGEVILTGRRQLRYWPGHERDEWQAETATVVRAICFARDVPAVAPIAETWAVPLHLCTVRAGAHDDRRPGSARRARLPITISDDAVTLTAHGITP
jgi:hypothetical protein